MNSAALSLMLRGGHLAQFSGKAKFLPALQVVYTYTITLLCFCVLHVGEAQF